jgi:hypothetical protein
MAERNTEIAADQRIEFRIGINVGDVVVEDGDIFGDGVNVAARLEGCGAWRDLCVQAIHEFMSEPDCTGLRSRPRWLLVGALAECARGRSARDPSLECRRIAGASPGQDRPTRHRVAEARVLFSTETGDAWLLDPADRLATRLARDGESEPIHIEETDTTFAIGWKGRYGIDGPGFVYSDHDTGRVATILSYPTDTLSQIA